MDLILRNARMIGAEQEPTDIGIEGGRIAVIQQQLAADGETIDLGGRLVSSGLIETHIHLDKSCILDRCRAEKGDLEEAIEEVARAKKGFTPEDVYARAKKTLEKSILNGTTHMRTQLEVDPGIGLRGLEGVRRLVEEYRWAIDIEICIFPQEGLLNNPGTDELMVEALKNGGSVVGAAPYTDSNPHGQIDRIFAMAREFDIDIDMHLDFAPSADNLDLLYVCEQTEKFNYGGRVAIGHVTKLSAAAPDLLARCGKRMADAGVALTVLPSTDLYLMGRHQDHSVMRGVTPSHRLLHHGVNCSLYTGRDQPPDNIRLDCLAYTRTEGDDHLIDLTIVAHTTGKFMSDANGDWPEAHGWTNVALFARPTVIDGGGVVLHRQHPGPGATNNLVVLISVNASRAGEPPSAAKWH